MEQPRTAGKDQATSRRESTASTAEAEDRHGKIANLMSSLSQAGSREERKVILDELAKHGVRVRPDTLRRIKTAGGGARKSRSHRRKSHRRKSHRRKPHRRKSHRRKSHGRRSR